MFKRYQNSFEMCSNLNLLISVIFFILRTDRSDAMYMICLFVCYSNCTVLSRQRIMEFLIRENTYYIVSEVYSMPFALLMFNYFYFIAIKWETEQKRKKANEMIHSESKRNENWQIEIYLVWNESQRNETKSIFIETSHRKSFWREISDWVQWSIRHGWYQKSTTSYGLLLIYFNIS